MFIHLQQIGAASPRKRKTPFPAGKGRQHLRSKIGAAVRQRLRYDQFPVVRDQNLRVKRRQVSWLMDRRSAAAFPTFVSDKMAVNSPNTVTGSYRIRTCFPFDPHGERPQKPSFRPQAPQFYIHF
jgi:hypothetical protein